MKLTRDQLIETMTYIFMHDLTTAQAADEIIEREEEKNDN